MRRKCANCGKVRTVEYQRGGDFFCSEACAFEETRCVLEFQCHACKKAFKSIDGNPVIIAIDRNNPYSTMPPRTYCSIECVLKEKGFTRLDKSGNPKEVEDET